MAQPSTGLARVAMLAFFYLPTHTTQHFLFIELKADNVWTVMRYL